MNLPVQVNHGSGVRCKANFSVLGIVFIISIQSSCKLGGCVLENRFPMVGIQPLCCLDKLAGSSAPGIVDEPKAASSFAGYIAVMRVFVFP